MKEHMTESKLFIKDYLKNDGLQALVEKTVAHKEFGNFKMAHVHHHEQHHEHHHEEKAAHKSAKKVSGKDEKPAEPEKVVVVEERPVAVSQPEPKVEICYSSPVATEPAVVHNTEPTTLTSSLPAAETPKSAEQAPPAEPLP